MEKNERINLASLSTATSGGERMPISQPINKTVNEIIMNTKNAMGAKFTPYSAYDNNCQNFILAVLHANGIHNATYDEFVKQHTDEIFKGKPGVRKFANTVTDIAGRANILVNGGDIVPKRKRKAVNAMT